MESYEKPIVNLVNELAIQLALSSLSFSSVVWETGIVLRTRGLMAITQPTFFVPIPSDGALFRNRTIYLAQSMQGKLTLDQWRPLLASALINYRGLRTRKIHWILKLTIPVVDLYIVAWLLLPQWFQTTQSCYSGK